MNRARVRPRAKARAPKARVRRPLNWRRAIGALCVWLSVAVLCFQMTTWALRPHCQAWLVRSEMPQIDHRMSQAKAAEESLSWQEAYVRTRKGAASLGRDYGFVGKNEVPFSVPAGKGLARRFATPPRVEQTLWDKTMLFACGICRAGPEIVKPSPKPRSKS